MRNPLQTTITHAEPVFDSFSAALGRALRAIGHAVEASGMVPRGKARATFTPAEVCGHAYSLVVVSCVAGGPDLPDPDPELDPRCGECRLGLGVHNLDDPLCEVREVVPFGARPDLEADGYSWGPGCRELMYDGLTHAEPPC